MTWLETQVRAVSLRHILLALAALTGFAVWCGMNYAYLINYVSGPKTIATADVAKIANLQSVEGDWIKVTPEKIIDSGVDHITTTRRRRGGESKSVTAHYYVGQFADRLLFIKAEQGYEPKGEVEGSFVPVPSDLFAAATGAKAPPGLKDRFLPVMLDTDDYRQYGNWGLTLGGVASLGALVFGGMALSRRANPAKHPALMALVAAPGAPSLTQASAGIEHDLAQGTVLKSKGHTLTSGYMAKTRGLSFKVNALSDLLWAYHRVTTKKMYGFIPVGRTHAVVMNYAKETVELPIKKAQAEGALQFIATHAPWSVVGFSDEVAAMFAKQKPQFIAAITDRRAQIATASGQTPPTAQT